MDCIFLMDKDGLVGEKRGKMHDGGGVLKVGKRGFMKRELEGEK